jgi:hypothetical protein
MLYKSRSKKRTERKKRRNKRKEHFNCRRSIESKQSLVKLIKDLNQLQMLEEKPFIIIIISIR